MTRKHKQFAPSAAGAFRPCTGGCSPSALTRFAIPDGGSFVFAAGCCVFALGCGLQDGDRNLQTSEVGLTDAVAPIFDDGQSQLFEVKRGLEFPILAPDAAQAAELGKDVEPYGRTPWLTNQDVKVQLTWTLSNLDDDGHDVEILIDPWNEFGRYYPGMQLADAADQKFEPNSSGIDHYYVLDGKASGEGSRRHGTFTFDDMNELAIDFATVMNMIKTPPPLPNGAKDDGTTMTDPLPIYANHAFNVQNRSYDDVLVKPYIPVVVAGLTGIDFGFRTSEKANVALEISIEIVDLGKGRMQQAGDDTPLLPPTTVVVTVGSPVPAAPTTTADPPDPASM